MYIATTSISSLLYLFIRIIIGVAISFLTGSVAYAYKHTHAHRIDFLTYCVCVCVRVLKINWLKMENLLLLIKVHFINKCADKKRWIENCEIPVSLLLCARAHSSFFMSTTTLWKLVQIKLKLVWYCALCGPPADLSSKIHIMCAFFVYENVTNTYTKLYKKKKRMKIKN